MAVHNELGKSGEEKAVAYLQMQGYTILERNWRWGRWEVDIICTDGELIVVVEVKTRTLPEEHPEELLDHRKRKHILRVGEAWLKKKGWKKELRFDLVVVVGQTGDVLHFPDTVRTID